MARPPSSPKRASSVPAAPRLRSEKAEDGLLARHVIEETEHWQGFLRRGGWWRDWTWLVLTATGVVAFGLGIAGARGSGWHRFETALHLFPSGFQGPPETSESDLLQAAQLLAPVVTYFVTGRLIVGVFRTQIWRIRARFRRDHAVVCGLGETGFRAAQGFLNDGRKVTCLTLAGGDDAVEHLRARGALVLEEDATQVVGLMKAAVHRAEDVVCACGPDSVNAQVAALTVDLLQRRGGRVARLSAHIADPDVAAMMRASALGLRAVRLQCFNIYAIWARALMRESPLGEAGEGPPHLVVFGSGKLAAAFVMRAARRWHFGAGHFAAGNAGRLRVTVVASDAGSLRDRLSLRYPGLPKHTDLVAVDEAADARGPAEILALLDERPASRCALIACLDDEGESLVFAQRLAAAVGPDGARVIVPATAWTFRVRRLLLGPLSGIIPVFYSPHPDSLDLLRDNLPETIARAVHEAYLHDVDDGRVAGDSGPLPADRAWDELTEEYREENRRHVDEMLGQLESLWYAVEPSFDWEAAPLELPSAHVETLARLEHERWCRDRTEAGWRYGPVRDDVARVNPLLVPWATLSEDARNVNRVLARDRSAILARAGLRVVRSPAREILAQALHRQYLETRRAEGDDATENPSLVSWDRLPEEQRELNRTGADDVADKLLRIGLRLVPAPDGHALELSSAELEALAEEEHARWARERTAQGWTYGERRDDEAKTHPDLVPWAELSEQRRQIDRDQVAALPGLIAGIGYAVV